MSDKWWRLLAKLGLVECALGFVSLAASMGTGHFGMAQAIDAVVNMVVLITAVRVLNITGWHGRMPHDTGRHASENTRASHDV